MKKSYRILALCMLCFAVVAQAQIVYGEKDDVITVTGSGKPESNPKPFNDFSLDDPKVIIKNLVARMVGVKGGKISTKNSKGKKTVHTVNDFCISPIEVTNAEWNVVMGETTNPSLYNRYFIGNDLKPAYANDRPVTGVTLAQAEAFCRKLTELTGIHFRLPSEIEWVYAARGGQFTHGYKYAGSNVGTDVAIYKGNTNHLYVGKIGDTHVSSSKPVAMPFPVAQMGKNELGLYDMSGNVWEWVANGRVYGGAFTESLKNCTVTSKSSMFINNKNQKTSQSVGFRIACETMGMG